MNVTQKNACWFLLVLIYTCAGSVLSVQSADPTLDDKARSATLARVSAIQKQICLGVRGYGELKDLHPTWTPTIPPDPAVVVDIVLDSARSSELFTRVTSDGELRITRRGRDEVLLRIRALLETSYLSTKPRALGTSDSETWWEGKVVQVYREEVAGTDVVITVEAASNDGVFPGLVRECLKKPPESMKPEIARLVQQLENEGEVAHAAPLLVRVGEYSPVIAILTNRNATIRRSAIIAIAGSNPNTSDGASVRSAVPHLIHLLRTGDANTRYLSAWALGHVRQEDETTVTALVAALDDEHQQTVTTAMMSLGEFKSQETVIVPVIINKLSNSNAIVRMQASRTLGQLSPCRDSGLARTIVAALIKTLEDPDGDVRGAAIWALGCNGEVARDAFPILLKLRESDDQVLRSQARAALMHIDFEAARKLGLLD